MTTRTENHDVVIGDYLRRFREANPQRPLPNLTYERGWYVFRADQGYVRGRYRRHAIDRLSRELERRVRECVNDGEPLNTKEG